MSRKLVPQRFERRHSAGQAIVELAISATFLAFLFAAAVDLGIAYKSYQTLMNATAEASTFLSIRPTLACHKCDPDDAEELSKALANREAIKRFRTEQGTAGGGSATTLDLDSNKADDLAEHGWEWIEERVVIQEADSSQIQVTDNRFAVDGDFNGTSDPDCLARKAFNSQNQPCYIVVRSVIIYHPFAISPAVGS